MKRICAINDKGNKRGIVLVGALAIMLILMTLGATQMMVSRSEIQSADNEVDVIRAEYLAEAGVQHFLAALRNGDINWGDASAEIFGDIDGNAETDYYAGVNWDSGIVTAQSFVPISRTVQVELGGDLFTGAMQAGGTIDIDNGSMTGTITGDIDAVGAVNLGGSLTIEGNIRQNNTSLNIPMPSESDYQAAADYSYTDCSSLGTTPPDGLYFINGNCTLSGSNFTLNGTLYVTGTTAVISAVDLTITPLAQYPALISKGTITITGSTRPTFNGLVYSSTNIALSATSYLRVNDGGFVAQGDITATNMQWLLPTFTEGLDLLYFSGTPNNITITSWQGHYSN